MIPKAIECRRIPGASGISSPHLSAEFNQAVSAHGTWRDNQMFLLTHCPWLFDPGASWVKGRRSNCSADFCSAGLQCRLKKSSSVDYDVWKFEAQLEDACRWKILAVKFLQVPVGVKLVFSCAPVLPRQWVVLPLPNHLRSSLIAKLASSPTTAHHCIGDSLHWRSGVRRSVIGTRWTPFRSISYYKWGLFPSPCPFLLF